MAIDRKSLSRRGFLKRTAAAAALAGVSRWTARSYGQIAGANDAIRIAVVGCNDCGRSHIRQVLAQSGARLVALCDADQAVMDRGMGVISAIPGAPGASSITQCRDYRKLLESGGIDAVTVATPNHWHALMTIWACQAGKDIYIEKPTCHDIWEGRQALAASRKYNRIVQAGTQWRSMPAVFEAMQWAKAANAGKILVSRGFCYKRRDSIGVTAGPQPIPATVDYDLWCGPSPKAPLRRKNLHYDWHWFWPNGNGDIGNQGAHQMDLARWALDKSTPAPSILSAGGRFGYADDGHTPNTLISVHDYGDALLIFEVRGLPTRAGAAARMDSYKGVDIGNVIECQGGHVSITAKQCGAYDGKGKLIRQFTGDGVDRDKSHMGNFLKAVRSRRREDQNGELAEGHTSSSLSHLSNISYRLGDLADAKTTAAAFGQSAAAHDAYARMAAHLAANGINLDVDQANLGVPLRLTADGRRFLDNPPADALLAGRYREPFVVPAQV